MPALPWRRNTIESRLVEATRSVNAVRDLYVREAYTNADLSERIAELEFQLEDANYIRLSGDFDREFSRHGLATIIRMSRMYYLKNPNIKRAVAVQALYCWAQGVSIEAENPDVDAVVQRFIGARDNKAELFGSVARYLKEVELQVTGNVFLTLFVRPAEGTVKVRSIPVEEITDIVCDPEDRRRPWYYLREWTAKTLNSESGQMEAQARRAYYPDWLYRPGQVKPATIGGAPVEWETPVYHIAVGGFQDQRFGLPETYQALDWARAYREFLEDRATLNRAHAKFAWNATTKAGAKGVDAIKNRLASAVSIGADIETNPAPASGATIVTTDGNKMEPVRTAGAVTSAEEGRRFLLQVGSAMGLPETFFGDVSTGNLATAKSLERPTELMFRERQELWRGVYEDLFYFATLEAVRAKKLNGSIIVDTTDAMETIDLGADADGNPIQPTAAVTFPALLEHDVEPLAKSWALFQSQIPPRLYLSVVLDIFNVPDADDVLEQVFPNGEGMELPEPDPEPNDPLSRQSMDQIEALREAVRILRGEATPA